ncbi:MAG: redoxin domain-containing protein [Bacteroidales bacterium]|jgi:peroxiredoxin|nr:redoxin domain-containing protein [Bacteroidales bacterium]
MKRFFLTRLAVAGIITAAMLASCSQQPAITADIKGLGNDTVFVIRVSLSYDDPEYDTLMASRDRFSYPLQPRDTNIILYFIPAQARTGSSSYALDNLSAELLVPRPTIIQITGSFDGNYINYSVTGSAISSDLAIERAKNKALNLQADSIFARFEAAADGTDQMVLYNQWRAVRSKIHVNNLEYIKQHPESELSGYFLMKNSDLGEFEDNYHALLPNVRNGMFKAVLEQMLYMRNAEREKLANKQIKAGADAPDFTLENIKGKDVSLKSIKGKHIVLDFWGSWCIWCIRGYPKMKEYYDKYKSQVEFVGIACRDTEDKWRAAVEENGLTWTQLFNPQAADPDKDLPTLYEVEGYPTKIIISPDYKVIQVFVGESEEFYQQLDELFKAD